MFTGIILHKGITRSFEARTGGARLVLEPPGFDSPVARGESIAINGVCLTAIPEDDGSISFDLSDETLRLTTLGKLTPGTPANLERALAVGDRLGGHIVQGHVDAVGALESRTSDGEFAVFRWSYPVEFDELVISKGSIAVDGVSLTIVEPDGRSFAAALIPETLERTNLGGASVGMPVNLEFDVMAKFAAKLLQPYRAARA